MKTFEATNHWATENKLKTWAQEKTTSTNDIAKSDLSYDLYITGEQTVGRGRNDNLWNNPQAGTSLLSTWRIEFDQAPQHLTGPLVGLAVIRSLNEAWPDHTWSLKAPNDIYLDHSKVAGILCETISIEPRYHLLIGLGINVTHHPQEIPAAGNLCEGLETEIDEKQWRSFLTSLRRHLDEMKDEVSRSELSDESRQEILLFLNRHPGSNNSYKDFDAQGNLHMVDGQIVSWQEL